MLKFKPLTWLTGGSLQRRFVVRVLAPPFFILLIMGVLGLLQIDKYIRSEAVGELSRSATSTAAKLEREFAIRKTVLKRTGEELFVIKSEYQSSRQKLDKDRQECSAFLTKKRSFLGSPGNVCTPFLAEFALQGAKPQAIEDSYVAIGETLVKDQKHKIDERLEAFNQFFPETLALLVVDEKKQLVSSALSDDLEGAADIFMPDIVSAASHPIDGKIYGVKNHRVAVFAYPITKGSVLAAYDLTSDSFIRETWESTPIDNNSALSVILDSEGFIAYPEPGTDEYFLDLNKKLRQEKYSEFNLQGIPQIAVGAESGSSKWLVIVASSKAVVFGPLRDAQVAAVIIMGTLLIGFLWVGAIFIYRTVRNILRLVSGALLFAAGNLDYKIKLTRADIEFMQLADTMNNMADKIDVANREIDEKNKEFISIATHELRTPLTAILGNLSIAYEDLGDRLDDVVKPVVEQAHKGTLRLRDLVNDMLDMARLEGGRVEFVLSPQNVQDIAKDVIETLLVTANEKSVQLEPLPSTVPLVQADKDKLRIILNNFVSNAIKYNRAGGTVKIYHTLKDNMVITAIADTGLGIPEDQKAHMFEKFFRVQDQDRQAITGTGLGMYVTRKYVEAMGGKVWFESTHGTGTTFYFNLPISEKPINNPNA